MGKATGTDQLLMKNTYPSLMGIARSKRFARQLTNSALKAIEEFDIKSDPLRAIASYIVSRTR